VWWYQVALVLAQLDGIFAGYLHNCDPDKVYSSQLVSQALLECPYALCRKQKLTKAEFWLMNSDGDVMDVGT